MSLKFISCPSGGGFEVLFETKLRRRWYCILIDFILVLVAVDDELLQITEVHFEHELLKFSFE